MARHILIVDDDENARLIARSVLEELQPEGALSECSGGLEALEYLRSVLHPPSAVLLDVRMPDLSGPELLKAIAEDAGLSEKLASTAFFLISNWDTEPLNQWPLVTNVRTVDKPFTTLDAELVVSVASGRQPAIGCSS